MATILVIDDDQLNREYLMTLLGYGGHRVIEATNGAEGLAQIRAEKPDLVIADVLMPTMDGFELARRIRTDPTIAHTNIIFWTAAYLGQEARNLAQRCGVSRMLRKPSDPPEVLRVVSESLGLSAPLLVPPAIAGFDRDHLRLLTDKRSQKVAELEAVGLRLQTLIDISGELAAEHDIDRLLDHVCDAAREILGASYAVVAIQDEAGQALQHYRIRGVSAELAAHMTLPSPHHDVISTLLTECRPLRRHNSGGDPQMLGFPADHPPVYSFLGAPIASSTRLYGWLGVWNKLGAFAAERPQRYPGLLQG